MIWKNTTDLGCGASKNGAGLYYIVCEYSPAGNVKDGYEDNVIPPKEKKKEDENNKKKD